MQQAIAILVFDIDGVIRDVGNSYRRALADTVEAFTNGHFRPSQAEIDQLKAEGLWNNDWEASQELIYRHYERRGTGRLQLDLSYEKVVDFFQRRYRGAILDDPDRWDGYITQEPLLVDAAHLLELQTSAIPWGFFSGATRGSATYVLQRRLGLHDPILIAMEDAPGKPDPTGLLQTVAQIEARFGLSNLLPVVYVGDTVADMQTVTAAKAVAGDRPWVGVGVLPPHAQSPADYAAAYTDKLHTAGAVRVVNTVRELTPPSVAELLDSHGHLG
ncbi:TIGR01548 family HAD-type hydrolase [Thermoleptolyngbya oregonensis NK1-22]|uniref:TIGR01548 family HAD-type hydrolase n=1 Tax=Thermoleptolyngbya oregonensis NK1-22 TaxID=2547457 RepID=A0AA96Y6L4_9CYAN|nr:TIGR01548 family HAD-type hydrolase [Thermoleptolyngbya oregonensis]WOB44511.1 TIGR01548 family HAD-type hydrolase [Thermoleptolyngbya oregonensis NK1-22]